MLDGFGDAFIAFDNDGRVTYCNKAAAAHYGVAWEDIVGRVLWDHPGFSDETGLEPFFKHVIASRQSVDGEAPSKSRPGRWFHIRAFPLSRGMGVSYHDVTERREQARREHEQAERLDLALATAGYGEWSWDPVADTVEFSPRAAEMNGAPPGVVLNARDLFEQVHAEDRESYRAAIGKALAEGSTFEMEYRFRRPTDGLERWMKVRGRARYDEGGQLISLLGVLTDITDAKLERDRIAADRARLAESEARFRAMANSAPAPVWVMDAEGGVEFVNQAFADLLGRPVEGLTHDGWISLLHPDDLERIKAARAIGPISVRSGDWEARFRFANGEYRWLRTASRPRLDDAGLFQGFIGIATDVTDALRAEERQRLLINELNHRVKNTLATIQSLARQTLRPGVTVEEGRERLTERLLALSAAHNVLTRENWESADLRQIVGEAVRPYEDDGGGRIAVEGDSARVAPNVALAVSMALNELATNAVKYGALSIPQGQVQLTWVQPAPGGTLLLEWRERDGPAVSAPTARGFGSRLLASLTTELGEPAEIAFNPDGLVCRLRIPVL